MTHANPDELAGGLLGVIQSADMALTDQEIETIGQAISYLRDQGDRRDGIRDKLDSAIGEESP